MRVKHLALGIMASLFAVICSYMGNYSPETGQFESVALAGTPADGKPQAKGGDDPDMFGIYISTLDGKNFKRVISDPRREINHARVSPDKKWITFTRYNKFGPDGYAKEDYGYEKCEVMLVRLDGTGLQTLVPGREKTIAGNSYWTPDGKSIIYVLKEPGQNSKILHLSLADKTSRKMPTPENFSSIDPHPVGDWIVFPKVNSGKDDNTLYLMKKDGSGLRQLTNRSMASNLRRIVKPLGDYDPKLSPDQSMVAFMRRFGPNSWHTIVIDLKTNQEKDLSEEDACDAVPEWSSDGKLLIFWHVDLKYLSNCGLYTMKPDGADRQKIPLPRGYFYTMPAFFPMEGSGDNARIIFSAKKEPLL